MQLFVAYVTVIWDNVYHFVRFCLTVMGIGFILAWCVLRKFCVNTYVHICALFVLCQHMLCTWLYRSISDLKSDGCAFCKFCSASIAELATAWSPGNAMERCKSHDIESDGPASTSTSKSIINNTFNIKSKGTNTTNMGITRSK